MGAHAFFSVIYRPWINLEHSAGALFVSKTRTNIYIDKLPTSTHKLPDAVASYWNILYADDTVIYCCHANLSEIERNLKEDLLNVAHWLNKNKLTLNLNKN